MTTPFDPLNPVSYWVLIMVAAVVVFVVYMLINYAVVPLIVMVIEAVTKPFRPVSVSEYRLRRRRHYKDTLALTAPAKFITVLHEPDKPAAPPVPFYEPDPVSNDSSGDVWFEILKKASKAREPEVSLADLGLDGIDDDSDISGGGFIRRN